MCNWNRRDFVATMEKGQADVQRRRNRGQGGGKAAKGHVRTTQRPEPYGRARAAEMRRLVEKVAMQIAAEDYLRNTYPERYEAFV